MLIRRELVDRVVSLLRHRSGEDEGIEATLCFLRAMLVGIEDEGPVPDPLLARVAELLKIEPNELILDPLTRRPSTRPPSVWPVAAAPSARRKKVLFLARSDAAVLAMLEAVGRTMLEGTAEVRSAGIAPVAFDPRALRALRHSGYATEQLAPRPVAVDDLSWADVVITTGGDRADWERYIPRSIPHEHHLIDDPVKSVRELGPDDDDQDVFRTTVRAVERLVSAMRPLRPSRSPSGSSFRAVSAPPPSQGNPALRRVGTAPPSSTKD